MTLSDEALWVTGGAGGQVAVTEDLESAAAALATAAHLLDEAGQSCARHTWIAEGVRQDAPAALATAAADAHDQATAATFGPYGPGAIADHLSDLGARLSRVAGEFLAAEHAATGRLSTIDVATAAVRDLVESVGWIARTANAFLWRWSLPGIVASGVGADPWGGALMPDGPPPTSALLTLGAAEHVAGTLDRVPGTPVTWEALRLPSLYDIAVAHLAVAIAGLEALLGEPRPRSATPLVTDPYVDPPRGIADLIDGVIRAHDDKDGAVGITEVAHADGSSAYIVAIPGTEDWGASSANPHDAHGNLDAVVGRQSDAMRVVVDAMVAAQIPPDAPVMLVGHSQGGIGAVALAASPAFRQAFRVTHVVTAGSPVGRLDAGPGVQQLHLQHRRDVVPGLDGRANRDAPTITTVEHDLSRAADPDIRALARTTPGAHQLDGYRYTAAVVDVHPSASTTAFRRSATDFLGGDSARYTEYVATAPPGSGGARPAAVF